MKNQFNEKIAKKFIEELMKAVERQYNVNIDYTLVKKEEEAK